MAELGAVNVGGLGVRETGHLGASLRVSENPICASERKNED